MPGIFLFEPCDMLSCLIQQFRVCLCVNLEGGNDALVVFLDPSSFSEGDAEGGPASGTGKVKGPAQCGASDWTATSVRRSLPGRRAVQPTAKWTGLGDSKWSHPF